MQVKDAIRTKRAVRQFTEQPVPDDVMTAILDAGRRAQSSKNTQPWRFIVIRDRAMLKSIAEAGTFASHLAGAAFVVVLVSANDRPGWNMFDLGQAAAYMQLEAWELGIGSCIANIYEEDKAKALLGVPSELGLQVALSFGYPASAPMPAKKGGRKPLEEVVRWERW